MNVGIIGTFDVNNYGDCLFTEIFAAQLYRRIGKLEMRFYSPTGRAAKITNLGKLHRLPGTIQECKDNGCDAMIIAGGQVITSGHNPSGIYCALPPGTMSAGMRLWMVPAILKAKYGIKFIVNAPGVGKLDPEAKDGLSSALKLADYITVRDSRSARILEELDCQVSVSHDCAFSVSELFNTKRWQKIAMNVLPDGLKFGSYLIVQAGMHHIIPDMWKWCYSIKKITNLVNIPVVLVPLCYHQSDHLFLKVAVSYFKSMGIKVYLLTKFLKTIETAALIANSFGYCGTSLHGAITAVSFKKPIVVFSRYKDTKYYGVMRTVECEHGVTSNIEQLHVAFEKSLNSDRARSFEKGLEGALEGFDRLEEILSRKKRKQSASQKILQSMHNAIGHDCSFYAGRNLDKMKRKVFMIIRSRPRLNMAYDAFSACMRGSNGISGSCGTLLAKLISTSLTGNFEA